ncbi:MAG: nuclear transport factor 2 family protein [Candidatus Sumerlaeia bacterium]|nr:nuclear transport factor 2 family protein [Candidatus Sumerlaeia bacterium]
MEKDGDVSRLGELWGQSLEAGDLDRVVALYAEGAIFLPTFYRIAVERYEVEDYFASLLKSEGLRVMIDECHVQELAPDLVSLAGLYTFSFLRNDERIELPARFTFLFRKFDSGWKIITHHSSECPAR